MGCVQVNNCNEYPEYPCFETEQKCKCGCPGSGVDPKAEECKCLDTKCVGGTIDKKDKDCPCRCPAGQFLSNGVCTPFQYNCNANNGTCYAVRANGTYATQQACRDAGCRGVPPPGPPCFPVPLAPAGVPLMCPPTPTYPAGHQYGLIMYIFNPAECDWTPIQIIWGSCEEPPPPPTTSSSSTTPSSSSSSSSCDCGALFEGVNNEIDEVCGQQVVTVGVIQPFWQGVQGICGGSIAIYEYCDTCDYLGRPVVKDITVLIPCPVISPDFPCALCPVAIAPGLIPPEGCPSSSSSSHTPVFSSSSSISSSSVSTSSASSSSSSSCAATGPTSISFSANSGSGQYLNKFGPGDFINVTVAVSDPAAAEEAQTSWTFFAKVGDTEYPINSGDITVGQYPINFTVSSETLLSLLGLTFQTAPSGYYAFPMCARAINCTGLTDEQCHGTVTVVVTGGQTNTSSSSGTTTGSSTTTSSTTSSATTTSSSSADSSSTGSSTSGGPAPSRLLYFTGASGGTTAHRWDVLTNWRLGSPVGPAATQLPTTSDDVVIIASIYDNVGAAACVRDMTVLDTAYTGISIEMIVYVSGVARFYGGAMIGNNISAGRIGEVHGNATFYDFSGNFGLVDGDATFMNDSYNDGGEINGQAIFNNDSILSAGIVHCNAEFNNNAARGGGAVYGTVTCNTSLACYTTSAGACNNTTPGTCPP